MTTPQPTLNPSSPSSNRKLKLNATTYQKQFIESTNHVEAFISGSGAGKTVAGKATQTLRMLKEPGNSWIVGEPTWDMVDRVLMRDFPGNPSLLGWLRMFDPGAVYEKSARIIRSTFGTIYLISGTEPQGMEGIHVRGIWLDEAGQMSKLAYETAERRASQTNGDLRITTTPYNRGWLYRDIFQAWEKGDPEINVIRCSSISNPAYSREAYERNRRNWTDARFNMFMEGGFERPEGMIYAKWDEADLTEPFKLPNEWPRRAAIDLGWNHPTAAVWAAYDANAADGRGVYYLYHEHLKGETVLSNHAKHIQAVEPPAEVIYGDPAAKQERSELRALGLPILPAKNEVNAGIDTVNDLMAEHRLKVFKPLVHWTDGVESYVWEQKHDAFTDKPVKIDDDLMDATRYLLHSWEHTRRLKLDN